MLFALVLLVLLIFALQNSQHAKVSFLGWHAKLPLGVALLLAAVFGVLLVALPGTARIVQLRVLARRRNRTATATEATPTEAPPTEAPPTGAPPIEPSPTEGTPADPRRAEPPVEAPPTAPPSSDIAGEPTPLPNEAPPLPNQPTAATRTRSPAQRSPETPSPVSPSPESPPSA